MVPIEFYHETRFALKRAGSNNLVTPSNRGKFQTQCESCEFLFFAFKTQTQMFTVFSSILLVAPPNINYEVPILPFSLVLKLNAFIRQPINWNSCIYILKQLFAEGEVVLLAAVRAAVTQRSLSPILGDQGATGRDDAIFSGERHFWRETLRAEDPLGTFLYQTSSRSGRIPPRWLARIFFPAQSKRRSSRVILSPSYSKWFSSSIDLVAWPLQWEDSREEFQNKD